VISVFSRTFAWVDLNTKNGIGLWVWTFLACPNPGGGKPINRFIQGLGDEALADLINVMSFLEHLDRDQWKRPEFDVLTGVNYRGMGEIRFYGERKKYRLFGYFGPSRLHFTLLHGTVKKGSVKKDLDTAAKRRDWAEANQGELYAFNFEAKSS
jgi:hypothetical protein